MTTALTVQTPLGPFDAVTAGLLDYTMAAADVAGNTFVCSGREILLAYNPAGGSTYTLGVTSVADEKGRTGTITAYSMAAGDFIIWTGGLTNSIGWKASTGLITVTANNAAVLLAVIKLPAGTPG